MKFNAPLLKGKLIKRYKRFLVDVLLENGEEVTAHCANSGAMYGIKEPGLTVWLSPADNPKRKLQYTLELVEADNTLIGANTSHPNKIVKEALESQKISLLSDYSQVKSEVKYGTNSRVDHLLTHPDLSDCYVEVKNVHMRREGTLAEFPDSVTSRGAKHLLELAQVVKQGHRAVLVYLVQREDCTAFKIAGDIDPTYAENAMIAKATGVEFLAYSCHMSTSEITLDQPLEIL